MQLDTFQKVTHDGGVFETNVRRLIAICGQHLRWRKDLSGIDLDMLRDAQLAWTVEKDAKSFWDVKWKETPLLGDLEEREEPCLEYESDIFWDLYRRIADEFERHFNVVELDGIPFSHKSYFNQFARDVWTSYFEKEIWAVLDFDRQFAVLVI